MSRALVVIDRLVVLVFGLLLVAIGVIGTIWWSGKVSALHGAPMLEWLRHLDRRSWWPWATGGGGVVIVLVCLRWMFAHTTRRRVDTLIIPGSSRSGRYEVKAGEVVDAAAEVLEASLDVRFASGMVTREGSQLIANITAKISPQADITKVGSDADKAILDIGRALGRDDISGRVELIVGRQASDRPRVH